jgi:hypothetical protein
LDEEADTHVSQREVLLSAGLFRFAAQLVAIAKELDELQEFARAGRKPVVLTDVASNVVRLERKT